MRKIFNIREKDYDILPHLEKQANMSQYIISLIREDMKKNKVLTEEKVVEIVEKYLSRKHLTTNKPTVEDFPIDSVLGIINMKG